MIEPVDYFKCLADETRLRCIVLLHGEGELCVCELTQALALSQPKISRHLAYLRQAGLLTDSRKGQWVYYRVNSELTSWLVSLLDETIKALNESAIYQQDVFRLKEMIDRPNSGQCCE